MQLSTAREGSCNPASPPLVGAPLAAGRVWSTPLAAFQGELAVSAVTMRSFLDVDRRGRSRLCF
eukprot:2213154-Rhodomonas_salina.1